MKKYSEKPHNRPTEYYTCVVCGANEVLYPYGILRAYYSTTRQCVCCATCNQKYLKGDYDHEV